MMELGGFLKKTQLHVHVHCSLKETNFLQLYSNVFRAKLKLIKRSFTSILIVKCDRSEHMFFRRLRQCYWFPSVLAVSHFSSSRCYRHLIVIGRLVTTAALESPVYHHADHTEITLRTVPKSLQQSNTLS